MEINLRLQESQESLQGSQEALSDAGAQELSGNPKKAHPTPDILHRPQQFPLHPRNQMTKGTVAGLAAGNWLSIRIGMLFLIMMTDGDT